MYICKYRRVDLVAGSGYYCDALKCQSRHKSKCPAYHGYDKKIRKPMVVKGWCRRMPGRLEARTGNTCLGVFRTPCTITISRAAYRALKRERR